MGSLIVLLRPFHGSRLRLHVVQIIGGAGKAALVAGIELTSDFERAPRPVFPCLACGVGETVPPCPRRIDPVLRALFRAAGAELVTPKTPPKVVIAEYVRITQAFFAEGREAKFVNAVLDHMAREARPEAF